jgi:Na+/proline symporter
MNPTMAIRIRGGAFLFRIAYYHFGVCLYLLDYTSAFFGWRVQQHVRGVVDFLSAGRSAGRYLVCNAVGQVSTGAVGMIAPFEMTYKAGFAINWWR